MERSVQTVRSDASLAEVVVCFAESHVSGLTVVDRNGRVIGIVSTTDILAAEAEAEGPGTRREMFESTSVLEFMTSLPHSVARSEDVREAARHMLYAGVHRLLVTEDDRVVGIVSITDIIRAVADARL